MSHKRTRSLPPELDGFIEDGWIDEVVSLVKSGKEATVYCCRACPSIGREYVAAKLYRSQAHRSFKNDSLYQEGRGHGNARDSRAYAKKTSWGRGVQQAMWTGHEFAMLQQLHAAGAIVPEPLTASSGAMLMEYIGDGAEPGRPLYSIELSGIQAREAFDLLLDNIALWLGNNIVHGDLSAYNILYTATQGVTVIDFPQAADARQSPHARMLLERDIANVAEYFAAYGLRVDPAKLAHRLWTEWKLGRL